MSNSGIFIEDKKPAFAEAMARAREIIASGFNPPLTRAEVFTIYRQCRVGGAIFLRCTFGESRGINVAAN